MQERAGTGSTSRTARQLAVLCLVRWAWDRQAVQPHIDAAIHASALSSQDRQLSVMLVQGVLRQMQHLDRIIAGFSRFPPARMKPLTLMALRVGVYQLLFLDRVPDSAAVNESVRVLREERQPRWLVNFANGVLRAIARNRENLPGPEEPDTQGSPVLNHPEWLVRRWQAVYGDETTVRICRANNHEPVLTLRVNTLRTTAMELAGKLKSCGCEVRPGRYAPDSLVLVRMSGPLSDLPGYAEGLFHVQDEAAQLVTLLLSPLLAEQRYLDACAGLGGKTCHLGQLLSEGTELLAVEPSAYRFCLLGQNLQRLRLADRVVPFHGRLEEFVATGPGQFSRILLDAPCSGTGVIGRHPDIRWNRKPEDLPAYQRQQRALLELARPLLAPGGVLLYATCSLEPEENQDLVKAFLREHPEFSVTDCREFLPPAAGELVDASGYFCPTPARGLDGFFAARLHRAC
ncbi:MAG TPA: 16S rRNA (cytosine(967)-C(5))-methyltransferase [Desulfobulbaceae bacterium]|nr:16S rRNA (cytosine(967)-C(5))-methyltransferase [Desulfobulbaceae bacterium]